MSQHHPRFVIDPRNNPNWNGVVEHCIDELRKTAAVRSLMVVFKPVARSLDQNAKIHPMLRDIARQVKVRVLDEDVLVGESEWKAIATAAFEEETRFAEYRGRIFALGTRTSEYSRQRCSEFIEFLYSLGSQEGVRWSETSLSHFERYSDVKPRRLA